MIDLHAYGSGKAFCLRPAPRLAMPVKSKKKAKAGANNSLIVKTKPLQLGALPDGEYSPNTEWLATIQKHIATIKNCETFGQSIMSAEPLPVSSDAAGALTGFQVPFEKKIAEQKFKGREDYICGVNLLWANPLLSITPCSAAASGSDPPTQGHHVPEWPCGSAAHLVPQAE